MIGSIPFAYISASYLLGGESRWCCGLYAGLWHRSERVRIPVILFIIKGFRTIVFIFIVISTMFWPMCPPAFFRCLSNSGTFTELRTTSFIESIGVSCSDSVCYNRVQVLSIVTRVQSELDLQPTDDCLLRSFGNQPLYYVCCWTVQSEFLELINLMFLLWIGWLLLCMIFLPVLIFRFIFHRAFLIVGSHIVFNSIQ